MEGPVGTSPPGTPTSQDVPEEGSKLKRSSSSQIKKKPEDFIFGKVIGAGSYSTVLLAKEVSSGKEFAIKVLEKKHILKEKKQEYVMREKEVFSRLNHPFFVKLYFTFQDLDRLYFGLSYARRGELLEFINKLGCFDRQCTQFYAAEIVLALEHLHGKGIIHRDLKPENILLNDDMHIQITDFGSTKIMNKGDASSDSDKKRKTSFVGTAQYVSPEILEAKPPCYSTDLWALGCIVYQLISGSFPFYGSHEYQIFQKINKLEYEFPEGFDPIARDLVQKLLVLNPAERLGCEEMGGYEKLKSHPFFEGVQWENLADQTPPQLMPYLPAKDEKSENLWSKHNQAGFDESHFTRLLTIEIQEGQDQEKKPKRAASDWVTEDERQSKLDVQRKENQYHRFVEDNLVLKQGLLDKRKGLFARRRMFLLTEGPHLYYVDPQNMVLKGQIPWSKDIRPEAKNFKIFFVHTPNRTYYLEDPEGNALKWCKKIEEVYQHYYGTKT